eukprot:TRINITY_DN10996_c0_g1_i13.p1 TRINITY_DN10996_c0_g1~~TRINITY_DN10996_c0_g1_i13.p1  ORF type:complete len:189 (-),score=48.57 TRINITY_DN10996_c0_g1_i13:118-684(-)
MWKEYGVECKGLTAEAQEFFLSEVLRRCVLYIPKDIEESTADEDIQIEVKPLVDVNFYRTLSGKKYKYPITFTLLGFKSELIGVKAAVYDQINYKENGMFFIVDPNEWGYSEEERKAVPKRKEYQRDELADFSYLPEKLKKKGYATLASLVRIEQNKQNEPVITYGDGNKVVYVEHLHNVFPNKKNLK